jgi:hypothetical protein
MFAGLNAINAKYQGTQKMQNLALPGLNRNSSGMDENTLETIKNNAQKLYDDYQEAKKTSTRLQPEYDKFQQNQGLLLAEFDKMTATPKVATASAIASNNSGTEKTKASKADNEVARGITGGGPRVININGVKFTDKIEITAGTMDGAVSDLEDKLQTMFLRVLNSGASAQ